MTNPVTAVILAVPDPREPPYQVEWAGVAIERYRGHRLTLPAVSGHTWHIKTRVKVAVAA